MTPVERLRAAEQRLRDVAGAATPGPWMVVPVNGITRADVRGRGEAVATAADSEFGACPAADATYIAALAPPVALALADWLAEVVDALPPIDRGGSSIPAPALAVADAVLGTTPAPPASDTPRSHR